VTKFLSVWEKSNSDFYFPSFRYPQIAADFQNFSGFSGRHTGCLNAAGIEILFVVLGWGTLPAVDLMKGGGQTRRLIF